MLHHYITFAIRKRSGGERAISTPATALKIIQKKLAQVLQQVYSPRSCVQGFAPDRSILTNAKPHVGQRYVLNVDLEDFFPSINFGRVRGMFMAAPYNLEPKVATVLAQICCFNNELPQGAPTSPIVSNMICAKLDGELQRLVARHRCAYTRYADDITLSTSLRQFPDSLATVVSDEAGRQIQLGDMLAGAISSNGFRVNQSKLRLLTRNRRQEVTGIVTNKRLNVRRRHVRQVRAMLHAWEKFGLEKAEQEFRERYDRKPRSPFKEAPDFKSVVKRKFTPPVCT